MRFFGLLITIIILVLSTIWIHFLLTPVVTDTPSISYVLQPGASAQTFIDDLYKKNILKHPVLFKLLLFVRGDMRHLKAGEYVFKRGVTPLDMINQMVEGHGIIYYSFTIVAGWNFKQLKTELLQETRLKHSLASLNDKEIMHLMGDPLLNPEGKFLPETYYFMEGSPDIMVLKRAYREMKSKFDKAWSTRDKDLPYKNSYEALIAASLVEKEAYLKSERPIIAGVLINRLRKDMILQFDPTVIYGMGSRYLGKIHKSDLLRDTPYNTYTRKGLPPTPIAMPSIDSIMAVLHPVQHDYLYFVAKGNGSHQFSQSLREHNHAVDQARKFEAKKDFFNVHLLRDMLKVYI